MKATRRLGLTLGMTALLSAVGCGGMAPPPSSPPQQAGYANEGPGSQSYPTDAPMGAKAEAAPAPPPAAPSSGSHGGARSAIENYQPRKAPAAEAPPADRPGLGTQWGETRVSRITTVPFVRGDASSPFATAAMYYNDEEGARAMTGSGGFRRTPAGSFTVASGLVSLGLRSERGGFLTGFVSGGRSYVVGESGQRYVIVVKNNTNFRLEVVLSVDGLDVLDGKAASFDKRGYIVDPRGEIEIDGFRQSTDTVAAFRFGSVRGSYAGQKHGDTRNVGVIGLAVFNEQGTNPVPWTPDEVQRRRDANPFPGQYATPP
jgi:hypothetical protein